MSPLSGFLFILEQRQQDLSKVSGMDDMFTFWLTISENLKDVLGDDVITVLKR